MNNISKILLDFKPEMENLLTALKKINAVFGYVSKDDTKIIADYFGVPESKVFETMSFYDEIKDEKPAQILIQVCTSPNCAVSSSFEIISEIENILKIKAGDDSNLKIKLEEVSCLGCCGDGPVMVVNEKAYERVSKSSVHGILEEYM